MKNSKNIFSDLPIALTGCALGLMTLTNAWKLWVNNQFKENLTFSNIFGMIITSGGFLLLTLFLTLIIIKYLSKPKIFVTEFKSPIIGSLIPTLFMAIFSWTAFLNSIKVPWLGEIIWLLVLISFVIYIICFSIYYIKNFSWKSVYPSWFVVWVGIIVFCVTGSTMGSSDTTIGLTVSQQKNFKEFLECLSKIIWYLGFSVYLILLPIVLIKVLFIELKVKSNEFPTYGIFGAPASLCLAGYLVAFFNTTSKLGEIQKPIVIFLFILGIIFIIFDYLIILPIMTKKFIPLFACFTFPLAITSFASEKLSQFLITEHNKTFSNIVHWISFTEIIIASFSILYVTFGLIVFSVNKLKYEPNNKEISKKFFKWFI